MGANRMAKDYIVVYSAIDAKTGRNITGNADITSSGIDTDNIDELRTKLRADIMARLPGVDVKSIMILNIIKLPL